MSEPWLNLGVVIPLSRPRREIPMIARWIQFAIERNVELVFVIEASVPDDLSIFLDFFSKYDAGGIKIIHGLFGSPGESRNEGLRHLNSEWVAFWDGDDEPQVIDFCEMVLAAEKNGYLVTAGGFQTKSVVTGEYFMYPILEKEQSLQKSIISNPGLWRFAFKKPYLKEAFFQDLSMGEDVVFLGVNLLNFQEVFCWNTVVYTYSIHDTGSLTSNKLKFVDGLRAADELRKRIGQSGKPEFLYALSIRLCLGAARHGNLVVKIRCFFWLLSTLLIHPKVLLSSRRYILK